MQECLHHVTYTKVSGKMTCDVRAYADNGISIAFVKVTKKLERGRESPRF